ncbi:MAG TPA: translocation/assembly module TamB domain-containing protein, partial [Bacteroidales bacterium]|nr:translocation/assembly module TamB domain-containing protein [Bacteroidales bacterium]
GTSAMAVTTTEMLSHQLSNWLSQISNDFDIGFVYRPGYKDINAQEVEVALSTQLLNDRVTINGNFDVRGAEKAAGTSDKITGDFDIEYKLTEKIRFRFFNRFNNPYTGKGAPYTQGFGLFFRKDFNQFADLFRKTGKSEMKKEDEVMIEGEGPEASR